MSSIFVALNVHDIGYSLAEKVCQALVVFEDDNMFSFVCPYHLPPSGGRVLNFTAKLMIPTRGNVAPGFQGSII